MLEVAAKIISENLDGKAARIVINDGEDVCQEVMHLHMQYVWHVLIDHSLMTDLPLCTFLPLCSHYSVIGGRIMRWPPG